VSPGRAVRSLGLALLVCACAGCAVVTTTVAVGSAAVTVGAAAVSVGVAAVGVAADAAVGTAKVVGSAVSGSDDSGRPATDGEGK
jgi:hypothetical protein